MAKNWTLEFGGIKFGDSSSANEVRTSPFQLLVLGNFSGQPRVEATHPGAAKPAFIDRDNFEDILAKVRPEIRVALGPDVPPVAVIIRELEDFEPDRLYQNLDVFQALRDLRDKLQSPGTFDEAASQLAGKVAALKARPEMIANIEPRPQNASAANPENLLEQMLESRSSVLEVLPEVGDWQRYLHNLVAPYLVEKPNPRQQEYVDVVDYAIAEKMRLILHDPGFQALEAAWRSLFLLIRGIDTDQQLKLFFWDVSCHTVAADLAGDDLRSSRTYKQLVEQSVGTQGGERWAGWIGLYTFMATKEDVELLGKVGVLAAAAGVPFIAGADPGMVGCTSFGQSPDPDDWKASPGADFQQAWQALRQAPQASHLGLAMPRIILRNPYGKSGTSTEQFSFEELNEDPPHDSFLWGNAATVCGYLLATGFRAGGWKFPSSRFTEMAGLPAAIVQKDGEAQVKPCAEAVLNDRAVDRITDAGLMLFQSPRDSDRVRLVRWQSIADPAQRLTGPWE